MFKLLKSLTTVRVPSIALQTARPGISRCLSSEGSTETEGEKKISSILKDKFPKATYVAVHDISGGCGSMYEIQLEAPEFKGKRTVMQHRMVNEALKEEIKDMHGLRISTAIPEGNTS